MLSKTCEYAVRAVIYIAQQTKDGNRVGIKDVAKGIDSPEYFIAKILQEMVRKNLLQSTKGPNGGFHLDEKYMKNSLAVIVRHFDGDKIFSGCALGLKRCSEKNPCPLHQQFKEIRNTLKHLLETTTINQLVEKLDSQEVFLKLNLE
ncbi:MULTISPECIES: Rrf2 family transcriptional regulator [Empedobacter]|uniref:Iron-responsive transcriptional regulator n=1 Tax=Empedobacter falsenii TaxID=343874 RepID=A0A376G2N2_9FLAO|nr:MULTISPECIES: Rrf2 family transcriptional regulator [Empedobacter]HBX63180.1 Rrf2 family transcriptional regulator [Flavobacteriaceae bacterium]MBY0067042.1 Rrf2 family transcriptional regulator [Empedobacter falsenii]MDH1601904.1 Rrf2 family transcriptional regulator [Empedobacter sp. GD03739]MDM1041746.1 Rrf2 family transcriptional regulator [Empedobacter brevis]MDM1135676.1 Rrf2 family transcriptional regulator [Empedobacter sp. R750]